MEDLEVYCDMKTAGWRVVGEYAFTKSVAHNVKQMNDIISDGNDMPSHWVGPWPSG